MPAESLRRIVRSASIAQIVVAVLWGFGGVGFVLIRDSSPHFGTLSNVVAAFLGIVTLLGAGIQGLRFLRSGVSARGLVLVNWVLVALWSVGLILTIVGMRGNPAIAAEAVIRIVDFAIIVPCVINGIVVQRLSYGAAGSRAAYTASARQGWRSVGKFVSRYVLTNLKRILSVVLAAVAVFLFAGTVLVAGQTIALGGLGGVAVEDVIAVIFGIVIVGGATWAAAALWERWRVPFGLMCFLVGLAYLINAFSSTLSFRNIPGDPGLLSVVGTFFLILCLLFVISDRRRHNPKTHSTA